MTKVEKPIVIYECVSGYFYMYDGKIKKEIDREDIKELKTKYTMIFLTRKRGEQKTLKQYYEYIIKCANELKKETKGRINMYKIGSFSEMALYLWKGELKKKKIITEPLTKLEELIIKDYKGPLIFTTKEYDGTGHKYDIISSYPYIMQDYRFFVPCRKPQEKIIKKISEAIEIIDDKPYIKYGLYHCIINKTNDEMIDRYFKFENHNWYTSIDLEIAQKLKLKAKMIMDNEPNFLYYDKKTKCETGRKIFCPFVPTLFELKQKKIYGAKEILNSLAGSIMKKNTMLKINHEVTDKTCKIQPDKKGICQSVEQEKLFKSDYARLKAFLYSQARLNIVNIMLKHKDNIVQCHTDGFISKVKLDIITGSHIGQLKYEGELANIHITNSNSIYGIKDIIKPTKKIDELDELEKEFKLLLISSK